MSAARARGGMKRNRRRKKIIKLALGWCIGERNYVFQERKVSSLSLTSNDSLCEYYNYVSVSWCCVRSRQK
jgi:ribosomal protein L20